MKFGSQFTYWPWKWGVVGFWCAFTIFTSSVGWFSIALRPDWASLAVWNCGWLLWAITTFPVVKLARLIPIRRSRLASRLAVHTAVGLLVALIQIFVEALFITFLDKIWPAVQLEYDDYTAIFYYRYYIYFLVYWAIVGTTYAIDYNARYHKTELISSKLATELAESQLQTLKAQLHPHFLFNTLNSIASLMLIGRTEDAMRMLTRLSDLLRLTLEDSNRQTTTLKDEIDALRLYASIEEERFHDRIQFQFDIPKVLLDKEIPYLLLQPLLENAISHGADPNSNKATIIIRAWQKNEVLNLVIEDEGRNLGTRKKEDTGHGIGLSNTRQRLDRLYGEKGKLELSSTAIGGTQARISLPCVAYSPENDNSLMS